MKIHPLPITKRRNIAIHHPTPSTGSLGKKLRRLPHIFTRVLELPFTSDVDVEVEERPESFRFVVPETDGFASGVIAHMVVIHPGLTKIVVRPRVGVRVWDLDRLELDVWRFRLPESTRPELASAVCVDGELIVTVPKGDYEEDDEDEDEDEDYGDVWGEGMENDDDDDNDSDRLVSVQ